MTFNPLKPKIKPTTKPPVYETPEAKLTKQAKRLNRSRLAWKSVSAVLLIGLLTLGYFYRNLQVTTELNTLKHDIELKQQLEKALTQPSSNANDPKAQ